MAITSIGLWMDEVGDDIPRWIVSRQDADGDDVGDPVGTYPAGRYDQAYERAKRLADRTGLPVIETDRHGQKEELYRPK
jgi:hypothetical protein